MGGFLSTNFDPVTDLPELKGKVIIVTGGNTGIGYATIKHLARRGAKVYMGARNESKATGAISRLEADGLEPGNGQVLWLKIDLSDPKNAKEAAKEFLRRETRLDILINNAALLIGLDPYRKAHCGVQDMMVVNHISPFVFTRHLLPLLKDTARKFGSDVRIVNVCTQGFKVTSIGHHYAAPRTRFRNLDDLNRDFATAWFPNFARYNMSKLANILWTKELQTRLDAENVPIIVLAVHPGVVDTVSHRLPKLRFIGKIIAWLFLKTWDQGAYNSVIAAASPVVRAYPEIYKGAYIEGYYGKVGKPSKNAQDVGIAAELWKTTEDFVTSIGLD